jgi:hypothetical protein
MAEVVAETGLITPHEAPKELIIHSDLPTEGNE